MYLKQIVRDQIKKHLFHTHKVKKTGELNQNATFRGWLTFDEIAPPNELTVSVSIKGGIVNLSKRKF